MKSATRIIMLIADGCYSLFETTKQTIEGGFPLLLRVVGSGRDFLADAFHEVGADRFCVLARFSAFLAIFGLDRRSVACGFGFGAHASPPRCGPAHGTEQLIGAVFVHQILSPGILVRGKDMPDRKSTRLN